MGTSNHFTKRYSSNNILRPFLKVTSPSKMETMNKIGITRYENIYKLVSKILKLALPAIGASFLSLTYNIVDIAFIGRIGKEEVAAVGSAGFYIHLGWALSSILSVGAGIKVAHCMGNKSLQKVSNYIKTSIVASVALAILYFLFILAFKVPLISFFNLEQNSTEQLARDYLIIVGSGFIFTFFNYLLSSIFIGYGNSKIPFKYNGIGVAINLILDPILIFSLQLGTNGAAIATLVSQLVTSILFLVRLRTLFNIQLFNLNFSKTQFIDIAKLGLNPAIQRIVFSLVAIYMGRIISSWGDVAIAVQKIGLQLEALTFMAAAGFSNALTTISGQAYGAKIYTLQWSSYVSGLPIVTFIGLITTYFFMVHPEFLFSLLINDLDTISMGVNYLRIIGLSQVFMCIEMLTTGAFYGWGKTKTPASISIVFTVLRIPLALLLISTVSNQVSSVWWSISLSSIIKGVVITLLFIYLLKSFIKKNNYNENN